MPQGRRRTPRYVLSLPLGTTCSAGTGPDDGRICEACGRLSLQHTAVQSCWHALPVAHSGSAEAAPRALLRLAGSVWQLLWHCRAVRQTADQPVPKPEPGSSCTTACWTRASTSASLLTVPSDRQLADGTAGSQYEWLCWPITAAGTATLLRQEQRPISAQLGRDLQSAWQPRLSPAGSQAETETRAVCGPDPAADNSHPRHARS